MNFDTKFAVEHPSKEVASHLNRLKDPSKVRLKVFSKDVKVFNGRVPKEYQRLPYRYKFDDHRTFLRVGQKCIGFMVSPYNLNTERHKAIALDGHSVIEMRQLHHINAETIAVIKNEYVNHIFWKLYTLQDETD